MPEFVRPENQCQRGRDRDGARNLSRVKLPCVGSESRQLDNSILKKLLPSLTKQGTVLFCQCCMSARKIDGGNSLPQQVTVQARQTRLSLSSNSVILHKNGIEFRTTTQFSPWTEMTLTLHSRQENRKFNCNGVVISCTGSKHTGYHVSMVFTGVSKQAQARLSEMAYSQLSWS